MKPMKLTDVGTNVEPYLDDPAWIMQQKMDGARMLVIYDGRKMFFTNNGTDPIAFSAAKLRLPELERHLRADLEALGVQHVILDGELIIEDGVYHVFDVLRAYGDIPYVGSNDRLAHRLSVLNGAFRALEGPLVRRVVTAYTFEEKTRLWELINKTGVEGAVSKHFDSIYAPGERSKEWVKHKLVKTADVVIQNPRRTFKDNGVVEKGSAELVVRIDPNDDPLPYVKTLNGRPTGKRAAKPTGKGPWLYFPRTWLTVGNASLIGKELMIEQGSVVEIEYLYWTGKAVIQPRIVRQRWDKAADECLLDQFPEYSRKSVYVEVTE